MNHFGQVEIAGSVALDLMALPDIDLYVRPDRDERHKLLGLLPDLNRQLSAQGYALAKIVLNDGHVIPDPHFPDPPGLYSGVTFVNQESGRVWKLDLWGWDDRFYDLRHRQHKELEEDLPGADRNLILRLKPRPGYGCTFVSIDVYAFALHGTGQTDADFELFLQERAERATP